MHIAKHGQHTAVDILMAVYNGEAYLEDQLESILGQSYPHWNLLISDDCSTDGSLAIANEYEKKDSRIRVVSSKVKYGGAKKNFLNLLRFSQSPFTMFCDQDDIWLPDKVRNHLATLIVSGERYGVDRPLLVFTDLKVVGSGLAPLDDSFFHYTRIKPERLRPEQIAVQNIVTGCSCAFNKPLVDALLLFADDEVIQMHDWCAGIIASEYGHIVYQNSTDILYRQHNANTLGANKFSMVSQFINKKDFANRLYNTTIQTRDIIDRMNQAYGYTAGEALQAFSKLFDHSRLERMAIACRYHLWKYGASRKLAQILSMAIVEKPRRNV